MADKRRVEIFTAGCPLCDETVRLVKELACPSCEVIVYNIKEQCESKECLDKMKQYNITSVPTVVVDGKIAECCKRGKVSKETLKAAGVGVPL